MKMSMEVKAERKEARKQARIKENRENEIAAHKAQPEVKELTITIEWKKSRIANVLRF